MTGAALRWLARHVLSLVVIMAILLGVEAFRRELSDVLTSNDQLGGVNQARTEVEGYLALEARAAAGRIAEIEKLGLDGLEERIRGLDVEIGALSPRGDPVGLMDLAGGQAVSKAKRQLRLELLEKERAFVAELAAFYKASRDREQARVDLERLRQEHQRAYSQLMRKTGELAAFELSHPVERWIPFTAAGRKHRTLSDERASLLQGNLEAHQRYESLRRQIDRLPSRGRPASPRFADSAALGELRALSEGLEEHVRSSWLNRFAQPIGAVLPLALMILVAIMVTPPAIKLFAFYVVAPAASRRPPLRLLPEAGGTILLGARDTDSNGKPTSAVSQVVAVGPGEELLVHPEYLQSTADIATKSTKWFLDPSLPLTSLASGMVGLTRITSATRQVFVVSAMTDPLSEVGLLTLPEGSAMVLQPRGLVGILQSIESPVKITRHWRVASLGAWLTFQFRYLVFHGPGTLIVKGCRGVRLEPADEGRGINQAATMGFSANVGYSVRRSETFMPYLTGKQGLFNDNFAGGPGFYLYEEVPDAARKAGIGGRGLEGAVDSLLKAFGI